MRKLILLGLSSLLIVLLFTCNADSYNYRVEEYNLTLEPRINSLDVKATIEINYFVDGKDSKRDGFKFVGGNEVDSLSCSDETGYITTNIEYLKETRISWQFAPVHSGFKKIRAMFMLRNFLEKRGLKYVMKAQWAGVFRVPVSKARYNIILPVSYKPLKFKDPGKWEHEVRNGLDCYFYVQSPLRKKNIDVQFGI
jgi:hypothetical protein